MTTLHITRIRPHATALIFALISLILSLPFALFMVFMGSAAGVPSGFGFFPFLMPVFYAVMSYIMVGLGCLIYNFAAGILGGIQLEVERH